MESQAISLSNEDFNLVMGRIHLQRLTEVLQKWQIHSVIPARYSVQRFLHLPESSQLEIISMIESYIRILNHDPNQVKNRSALEMEASRLKRCAEEFNMRIADESVFNLINDGDVVEAYDAQGKQIYRNLMFCKLSSYSLLDVAVNTWQELYERPMSTIRALEAKVIEQMTTSVLTRPFEVEDHILKEKFAYSARKRVFMMSMRYISPLLDATSDKRVGVIAIVRVTPIDQSGSDAGDLQIL